MALDVPEAAVKLRNTIIASAVGGIAMVGLCLGLTGGTMDMMKEQAATTLAEMSSESAASSKTDGVVSSNVADSSKPVSEATSSSVNSDDRAVQDEAKPIDESMPADNVYVLDDGIASKVDVNESSDEIDEGGSTATCRVITDSGDVHIIEYGDTLSHISSRYGRSVDEFAALNHIENVNLIYAESALRVPTDADYE